MFPSSHIGILSQVRDFFFPVIWFDEGAEIDSDWTKKYKNMVTLPLTLVDVFTYTGIAVGSISVVIAIISFCLTVAK